MAKRNKSYKVISLFSGCGGLDLGFEGGFKYLKKNYAKHNFEVVWANDIDASSCETFMKNFPRHNIVCGDIRDILNENALPEKADIVLGGFPCQDFSLAGKRRGFNSKRGVLYRSMVEVVRRTEPLIFVAENVKGLLSMNKGKAIKKIERDFGALGYHVSTHLHLAANFGVPQARERVILVGTLERELPKFKHPEPPFGPDNWVTLGEAIGDLELLKEGALPNHYWSHAKMFPGTQGNSVVARDKVGPTMRAEHHGNIEWHWNKKRRLSAREAARIQSFPDNFVFYPSTSSAYKQIGNAVAPVFGWYIAGAIEKFLNENLKVK